VALGIDKNASRRTCLANSWFAAFDRPNALSRLPCAHASAGCGNNLKGVSRPELIRADRGIVFNRNL
jgi:hypothetical protein